MTRILRKVHSESGASIILALMLFLICGFIAAVTLGSAAVNARKYEKQRESQQKYLSVSSAAQMFRDTVSGNSLTGTEEQWIYYCGSTLTGTMEDPSPDYHPDRAGYCGELTITKGDSKLSKMIAEAAYSVYKSKLKYKDNLREEFSGWNRDFIIEADHMVPVKAVLSIDSNYNLTIQLRSDTSTTDEYSLTLTFHAETEFPPDDIKKFSCTHTGQIDVIHSDGTPGKETVSINIENEHYTSLTKISWQDCVIRKGAFIP